MTRPPISGTPAPALEIALALISGVLLTFMVLLNGEMGRATTPLFSSLAAHATGTLAALVFIAAVRLRGRAAPAGAAGYGRAPLWAYLGGLSGALTVVLTSTTVNTPLALAGTIALGLAGQAAFSLVTDRFGWFGLPVRHPKAADFVALALVLAGSGLILFGGAP